MLYGHTPVPEPEWVNNTLCLDTGCVFGGRLTALRYPERELVSVPAAAVYYEPVRPFPANPDLSGRAASGPAGHGDGAAAHRDPGVLDITDVTGRRTIETATQGRITVRADNAAAALEVMSRFAIDPRWLVYLPPTMSPVATSARPGLLEHPDEAFSAYRADGVDRGRVRGEAHGIAGGRPDLPGRAGRAGQVRCGRRCGRSGVDQDRTGVLRARADRPSCSAGSRAAAEAAGLFGELDAELGAA